MIRAALVVLALSGCATTFDIAYLVSKPKNELRETTPDVASHRGPDATSHRYLELDGNGVPMCLDEQRWTDEQPAVTRYERPSKGLIPKAYAFAPMFNAIITFPGAMFAARFACAEPDCGPVGTTSLLIAGAITLADSAWGVYRALTVEPTTLLQATLSYEQTPRVVTTPCPFGTEITLQRAGGETLTLRFEENGRLAMSIGAKLEGFVANASDVTIFGEASVSVDVPLLQDLARAVAAPSGPRAPIRIELRR